MTTQNVAILIVSCDKYNDVWSLFFRTFRKYWPDCDYKIYLGTNNLKCVEANVQTINIGDDLSYSENLTKMLNQIDSEYVITWVDDLMLTSDVDSEKIKKIVDYAIKNDIDFVKLLPNYPYAYKEEMHGIGRLPNGIKYQVTIGISIIKKSFMKASISGKKSAWELEYEISNNIKSDNDKKIYALTSNAVNYPINYINVLGRGRVIRNSQKYIFENGARHLAIDRGLQPVKEYLYYRLYLIYLSILKKLNIYWKIK